MFHFQPLDENATKKCIEALTHFIIGTLQPYKVVVRSKELKKIYSQNFKPTLYNSWLKIFHKICYSPQLYNKTAGRGGVREIVINSNG